MWGNGKIFVSHAHTDNERCEPLLAALDAWGLDYWFDTQQLDAGAQLTDRLQRALGERDILLRVCTGATRPSYWMTLEFSAFRGLQLSEQQQRKQGTNRRLSINLILDAAYKSAATSADAFNERADALVDATAGTPAVWLAQLGAALGIVPRKHARKGMSRRAAIGLGAAAVVTAAAAGTAVVVRERPSTSVAIVPKPTKVPFAVPNPQTVDPRMLWNFRAGDSSAPAITLGPKALYVNSSDSFYALNPSDGSIIWANPAVTGNGAEVPVLVGEKLYVLEGLGSLTALSTTDGGGEWIVDTNNIFGVGIAVAGDIIFTWAGDGSILAYSTSDGTKLWQSSVLASPGLSSPTPTASAGMVLVGAADGGFYALSASNGSKAWRYQTGGEIEASAAVGGGTVYFGSKDATLYALEIATGALKWRVTLDLDVDTAPVVSGKAVYIGVGSTLYAFDAETGTKLWAVPVGDVDASGNNTSFDGVSAAVAVDGDSIYVPCGSYLYAFSSPTNAAYSPSSGKPAYLWRFNAPAAFDNRGTPIVGSNVVFFSADDRSVYALKTV